VVLLNGCQVDGGAVVGELRMGNHLSDCYTPASQPSPSMLHPTSGSVADSQAGYGYGIMEVMTRVEPDFVGFSSITGAALHRVMPAEECIVAKDRFKFVDTENALDGRHSCV